MQIAVDFSLVEDLCNEDVVTAQKMFHLFLKNVPQAIADMLEAVTKEDWAGVHKIAHHTKSSLSIIQIPQLQTLLSQVEQKAKHLQDLDSVLPMLQQADIFFKAAEVQINTKLNSIV